MGINTKEYNFDLNRETYINETQEISPSLLPAWNSTRICAQQWLGINEVHRSAQPVF